MNQEAEDISKGRVGFLNITVLVLSVYVLVALLVSSIFKLPTEISRVLDLVDNGICLFFIIEFLIRFYNADNKLRFLKWGWLDLISSIPNIDFLRAGRAFRLIRILRILRAFRSTKHLIGHIYQNPAQGAFTTVSILAVVLILFSSIVILQLEDSPDSNIKTAEDALWWSYVTITTVGYGDKFPVTTGGRMLAAVLMTAGVGLFGTFTAYISSWFLANRNNQQKSFEDKDP